MNKNYLIIYPRCAKISEPQQWQFFQEEHWDLHGHALSLLERLTQKRNVTVDLISIPVESDSFMLPSDIPLPDVVYVVGHHAQDGSFGTKCSQGGVDFSPEACAEWLNKCDFLQYGRCALKLMACYTATPITFFEGETFAQRVKRNLSNQDITVRGYDGKVRESKSFTGRWHTYSEQEGELVRASAVAKSY